MGVILTTVALAVQNKGGGFPTKTVKSDKIEMPVLERLVRKSKHVHLRSRKRVKGSDYIIFNCPGCDSRNKQSMYQTKGKADDALSFRCNRCRREIEVSRPTPVPDRIIVDPSSPARAISSLVGPDGKAIGV